MAFGGSVGKVCLPDGYSRLTSDDSNRLPQSVDGAAPRQRQADGRFRGDPSSRPLLISRVPLTYTKPVQNFGFVHVLPVAFDPLF